MIVTLVHHRVADYGAWKEVYDAFADTQRRGGVRSQSVLRSTEDPNLIVVTHSFDTADAAHAFFSNEELKDAMAQAGVDISTFTVEFLDEVESGAP